MAKVKVFNESSSKVTGGYYNIKGDININADGEFYFKLLDEHLPYAESMIEDKKFPLLEPAKVGGRTHNHLVCPTMKGLEAALKRLAYTIANSGTKEELLIMYRINNQVSYFKHKDGSIHPNGERFGNHLVQDIGEWCGGRPTFASEKWDNYSVQVYAQVVKKITQEGSTDIRYSWPDRGSLGKCGDALNAFTHLTIPKSRSHHDGIDAEDCVAIPYTEERAKFFHDMLLGMCKLAEKFSALQDEKTLLKLADSGKFLLMSPEEKKK